jgi:hypothetical protein
MKSRKETIGITIPRLSKAKEVGRPLRSGQIECYLELPPPRYLQKPINEGAAVIDLLTFDSNPSMLYAADQRSTLGEINPNISESHEDNLTR